MLSQTKLKHFKTSLLGLLFHCGEQVSNKTKIQSVFLQQAFLQQDRRNGIFHNHRHSKPHHLNRHAWL